MTVYAGSDRRKSQRFEIPMRVKLVLPANKQARAETMQAENVSGGGLCVRSGRRMAVGTRLKTFLYFPSQRRAVSSAGQVVSCRTPLSEDPAGQYHVGIRHLKIAKKDRADFILNFCEAMVNHCVSMNDQGRF